MREKAAKFEKDEAKKEKSRNDRRTKASKMPKLYTRENMLSAPYSLADLLKRSDEIIELLGAGALVTCVYLTERFRACDVSKNEVYKLIYSGYYRLTGAGLTEAFFARYFEILEQTKSSGFDPVVIAQNLKKFKNRKGQLSLQFSFITKIGTTFDPNLPVYDSRLVKLFGIRNSKIVRDYDKRLRAHLDDLEEIKTRIGMCLKVPTFSDLVDRFRCNMGEPAGILPDTRLADLILWAYHQISSNSR